MRGKIEKRLLYIALGSELCMMEHRLISLIDALYFEGVPEAYLIEELFKFQLN